MSKKEPDWVNEVIQEQTFRTPEGEKKPRVDIDSLFQLAEANGIDTADYKKQVGTPNATGRLVMTISNMLRTRARRRHGLFDLNRKALKAPAEFVAGNEKTEDLEGNEIKSKAAA